MTRTRSVIASFFVFLEVFSLVLLCGCGESTPSRSEVTKILEKHLSKCYGLAVPANLTLGSTSDPRYIHVNLARDLELVETSQTAGPYGRANLEITLTEKGNAGPAFEDIHKNILFLVSENKIDEIVEIAKQPGKNKQCIVSFAYTQTYNEVGKKIAGEMVQYGYSWLDDNTKLRGKATVVYDAYLKRYVLQNMMWSEWEHQKWNPAHFVINANKERALYYSYERREQVATPVTREFPTNQERRWEMERRNAERAERLQQQRAEAEKRREASQRAQEERRREMDRLRTSRQLRQLEREAEMQRRAERAEQQREEYERRKAEQELNKKLLR